MDSPFTGQSFLLSQDQSSIHWQLHSSQPEEHNVTEKTSMPHSFSLTESLLQQTNIDPALPNRALHQLHAGIIPLDSSPHTHPPQQQHSSETTNTPNHPVKIRKKPGPKPNPASPANRKAQNRAAQRAFRERKERHLRDLENTIRVLRQQRNKAIKELHTIKTSFDALKTENWYLKGVMLSLQFVCLHHNIKIPTHTPYLSDNTLLDMAHASPHAIEAYVKVSTRNNAHLKPAMVSHFLNGHKNHNGSIVMDETTETRESHPDDDFSIPSSGDVDMYTPEAKGADSSASMRSSSLTPHLESIKTQVSPNTPATSDNMKRENTSCFPPQDNPKVGHGPNFGVDSCPWSSNTQEPQGAAGPAPSSLGAIQQLRLQLRFRSSVVRIGDEAHASLQPTLLQLAVPHDPRIDLIPTSHMRDRMILFRDIMDYDRCFSILLNGSVLHGADPTKGDNWELPAEFFNEFWFLIIDYDIKRTNLWRVSKGLDPVEAGPKRCNHKLPMDPVSLGSNVQDDLTRAMPSLQPLDPFYPQENSLLHHPPLDLLVDAPPLESVPAQYPEMNSVMDFIASLPTNI